MIEKVTTSIKAVESADFGSVREDSNKIECTESESLIPKLRHLWDSINELDRWTFVQEITNTDKEGNRVVVTSGDQYHREEKFRVMSVLCLWKHKEGNDLINSYKNAEKGSATVKRD